MNGGWSIFLAILIVFIAWRWNRAHRKIDRRRVRAPHPYDEALDTPHWRAMREWVYLYRARGHCEQCGRWFAMKDMVLHHLHYETVFAERPQDVLGVCRSCHNYLHSLPGAPSRVA